MDLLKDKICFVSASVIIKEVDGRLVGVKRGSPTRQDILLAKEHCRLDTIDWEDSDGKVNLESDDRSEEGVGL